MSAVSLETFADMSLAYQPISVRKRLPAVAESVAPNHPIVAARRDMNLSEYYRYLLATNPLNIVFLSQITLTSFRRRAFGIARRILRRSIRRTKFEILFVPERSELWPDHILVYSAAFRKNILVVLHSSEQAQDWQPHQVPSGWGSIAYRRLPQSFDALPPDELRSIAAGWPVSKVDALSDLNDLERAYHFQHLCTQD